jgi:hypothetical protein
VLNVYPRDYFAYNPTTGDLRWAISPLGSVHVGDPVGHLSSKGKLECSIKRRKVPVITVAWYAHYGKWREDLTVADGDRKHNAATARSAKKAKPVQARSSYFQQWARLPGRARRASATSLGAAAFGIGASV